MAATDFNKLYGDDLQLTVAIIGDYGSSSNSIDITQQIGELNISESIYSPGMIIDITVVDAQGALTSLPATGQEIIAVSLKSRSRRSLALAFRLVKIERPTALQEKSYSYIIHGSSQILETSLNKVCFNHFAGQGGHTIVSKIFNEYLKEGLTSSRRLSVESTSNLLTYTGAGHSPLEFIQMAAADSQSGSYPNSSVFVFYENARGFFFRTINDMLQQGPVAEFYYADPQTEQGQNKNYITGFTWHHTMDAIDALTSGMINNTVAAIDPITKTYNEYTFNYSRDYKKLTHIRGGGKPFVRAKSGGGSILGDSLDGSSHVRFIPTDFNVDINNQTIDGRINASNDPFKFHASTKHQFLPGRVAMMTSLRQHRVDVTTSYVTDVHAGDIIRIFIPSNTGEENSAAKYVKYYGQKNPTFLVTGTTISFNGKDGTFFSTFECSKESYGLSLANQGGVSSSLKQILPFGQDIAEVATNAGQEILEELLPKGVSDFFKKIGTKLG